MIELLIVLAVMAALMAIATPIALNAVARANVMRVASNMRNIKSAIESYVSIERPSDTSGLDLDIDDLVDSGYLSANPGNEYEMKVDNANWATKGEVIVTISYTGNDVDTTKLQEAYPDVKIVNNTPTITLTLRKWW